MPNQQYVNKLKNSLTQKLNASDFQTAVDYINEIIKHENTAFNFKLKGDCLLKLKKNDEAISSYNKAMEKGLIDDASLYCNKAVACGRKAEYSKAINLLDQAIRIDPTQSTYYYNKARYLIFQEKFKEAIEYCDKAIERGFPEKYLTFQKASCYKGLGKYSEALEWCNKYIYHNPQDVYGFLTKSLILKESDKYSEALACLTQAEGINNSSFAHEIYKNKARISLELNNHEEALKYFDKLEFDKMEQTDYILKYQCLCHVRDHQEALYWLYKIEDYSDRKDELYYEKASLHHKLHEYEKAIEHYDKYLADSSEDRAQVLEYKGWCLFGLEKYHQAQDIAYELEKLLKMQGEDNHPARVLKHKAISELEELRIDQDEQENEESDSIDLTKSETYFQLEDPNGNMVYTKDGNFKIDPNQGNQLVHSASNNLLVPNVALPNANEFEISTLEIDQYGVATIVQDEEQVMLDRIQLATFNNTNNLVNIGNNLVAPRDGEEPIIFYPGDENNSAIQEVVSREPNSETTTEFIKMAIVNKTPEICYDYSKEDDQWQNQQGEATEGLIIEDNACEGLGKINQLFEDDEFSTGE